MLAPLTEQRDDVFDTGYSTSQDGAGFGLSIVKRITEAHDWNICVTESPRGGARFEITSVKFID
ncbi:ATP-binding protein [Natrinema sp. 1APR25-10V2]|uniref:sensor histidine kinase n=1 Tax=Natrinema sp. 1APR25-10V2 TaxID=2951081 RepID=UPI0028753667|nr:ATP-binding protein [Natrinema sp. 1APR25-10V2]MDS0474056.1 ATP-binding protein [Natrinema sp. 1APR25-10V2]